MLARPHDRPLVRAHLDRARLVGRFAFPIACLGVAACLGAGCGGIGSTYEVHVDPGFTTDEQAKVVAALEAWEAAVPVHFTVEIGPCSGVHGGMICTHASNRTEMASKGAQDGAGLGLTVREKTWGHVVDGGEVFVDVPTVEASYPDDFQRIVAHEVGHAMQLEHNAPLHLMAAMATEDAPAPTCDDDAQWYAVRGQPSPVCTTP